MVSPGGMQCYGDIHLGKHVTYMVGFMKFFYPKDDLRAQVGGMGLLLETC